MFRKPDWRNQPRASALYQGMTLFNRAAKLYSLGFSPLLLCQTLTHIHPYRPPPALVTGAAASRTRMGNLGNENVPPASSITLIWQVYRPGLSWFRGTSN